MSINWLEILKAVALVILGGAVVYFKSNPKLQSKAKEVEEWVEHLRGAAVEFIARAEREFVGTKRGGEKFIWVVNGLYNMLPDTLKPFIGKDLIGSIVQSTFDVVESYAKVQLDRLVDKVVESDNEEGA